MHAPIKYVEKGISIAANGAWAVFSTLNKIKGLLAEQTEESLLSVCTRCEPALALIRICLEEQDPTVVMLKFALEVAQQKATGLFAQITSATGASSSSIRGASNGFEDASETRPRLLGLSSIDAIV